MQTMSGDDEFDDLLAAFNIPITDGQNKKSTKKTSTASDLLSPKKLALNGNASTCEKTDNESEDDEGWIIDEDGSSEINKNEDAPKPNGENSSDILLKGRRKQVFPKLREKPCISASSTPMQGWKAKGISTQSYIDGQQNRVTIPFLQFNTSKHSQPSLRSISLPAVHDLNDALVPSNSSSVSCTHVSSNIPTTTPPDKVMMPVIDPDSVVSNAVSQAMVFKPTFSNNPAICAKIDPKLESEAVGLPLTSKLINVKSFPCQTYKPSVPLSTYKEFDAPTYGYSCRACDCCFLSDASLQAHLKRPSLTIKYQCDQCCSQYIFHNKCSFWIHIIVHSENALNNTDTLAKSITIIPITIKEFLNCNIETVHPSAPQNYEAAYVDKGQMPTAQCPACTQKVKDLVRHHLGQFDSANMSQCPTCKRVLKNSCERQLHQVAHNDGKLCPGCGAEHLNVKEYYDHGSSSDCLYWLSFPLLTCWICSSSFYHLDHFIEHLCNQHALSYYKCSCCQLAFRNFSALYLHLTKEHPAIKQLPKPQQQRILKCPLCKNVFASVEAILTHLRSIHSSYIFERIKRVVYRCLLCPHSVHFVDRQGLQKHMHVAHSGKGHSVMCDLCGKVISSVEDLSAHRPVCWQKSQQVVKKGANSEQYRLVASFPTKSKRVLQCSKCPTSKRVFYSTLAGYKSHFRNAHSGTTPLPKEIDLITAGTSPSKGVCKMPNELSVSSTVKLPECNALGTSKRSFPKATPCSDQIGIKKSKVTPQTPLSCIKCGFSSDNRDKFLIHIKTHKENSSYEQCHECGLCFRSKMAVTRHMAMKHLIQTPVAPVIMPLSSPVVQSPVKPKPPKDEVSPPKVTHPSKSKPETARLECTVCYRLFTTDILLRNHMRTHGMAFIRSKRSTTFKVEAT